MRQVVLVNTFFLLHAAMSSSLTMEMRLKPSLTLELIIDDFARAMMEVDATRPVWVTRTGRSYRPGIGPHPENVVVSMVLAALHSNSATFDSSGQGIRYPGTTQKCDVWFGDPLEWVVEVKMARLFGDNGKPDDTAIKDILSPYPAHRSALTDCAKLADSDFKCSKAVLIYGFDYAPDYPLTPLVDAFELLARQNVRLGSRISSQLRNLVRPVHTNGTVFGWEVHESVEGKG